MLESLINILTANSTITEAKQRLAEMKYEHSRMQEVLGEDRDLQSIQLQRNMLATFNSMLVSSLEPLTSTLTDRQQEILNESGYSDLMRNSSQIINCAMLLSLGYIREATTYAESCGGAVRLALVGDETKMRMMSIGGAGALLCQLR